ncbi:MAG: mannitol dehydrogenase family protein [Terracidiphilus sp.]
MHIPPGQTPVPLRSSTLSQFPDTIVRPRYDRSRSLPGLVHIGVGGFNRSHLAVYLDDLLARSDSKRWGEFGVGLLPGDRQVHAALTEQDFLYGHLQVDSDQQGYRIIGSLVGHLYAPESTEAVLDRLTSPDCAIVSLTVTEGGYFVEDASGRFLADHEDVRRDLEHPEFPGTWLGYVAEASNRRMRLGRSPFTLLSCDNLQANGETARTALLSFAGARSTALQKWMETNISFPNSMVDRITPRTTDDNRATIANKFGVLDLSPVVSEPFRQWVLEDAFIAGRPAWELVGAQMTTDVAPYEKTKMRLLNGGHSAIGYAADLLGHKTIADAMADPLLHELLEHFMAEVRPTLFQLPGIDLTTYAATIVKRFSNSAIQDQVARICSDGCTKMAKFIVPSLVDLLEGREFPRVLPFVIASWLHYLRGYDESGRKLTISDPSLAYLQPFLGAGGGEARLALSVRPLFGEIALTHPQIVSAVQTSLDELRTAGVRAAISQMLAKVEIR